MNPAQHSERFRPVTPEIVTGSVVVGGLSVPLAVDTFYENPHIEDPNNEISEEVQQHDDVLEGIIAFREELAQQGDIPPEVNQVTDAVAEEQVDAIARLNAERPEQLSFVEWSGLTVAGILAIGAISTAVRSARYWRQTRQADKPPKQKSVPAEAKLAYRAHSASAPKV